VDYLSAIDRRTDFIERFIREEAGSKQRSQQKLMGMFQQVITDFKKEVAQQEGLRQVSRLASSVTRARGRCSRCTTRTCTTPPTISASSSCSRSCGSSRVARSFGWERYVVVGRMPAVTLETVSQDAHDGTAMFAVWEGCVFRSRYRFRTLTRRGAAIANTWATSEWI
jgi:hypothetical protein